MADRGDRLGLIGKVPDDLQHAAVQQRPVRGFAVVSRALVGRKAQQFLGAAQAVEKARGVRRQRVVFGQRHERRARDVIDPAVHGEELDRALSELEPKLANLSAMGVRAPEGGATHASAAVRVEPVASGYAAGQQVATREAYGEALARLGDVNPRIVVLDGDTKNSTYSEKFMKAHGAELGLGLAAAAAVMGGIMLWLRRRYGTAAA